MQNLREIEKHLQYIHPDLRDIVLELRNLIASVAPNATEDIRFKGLSYYFKEHGGPVSAGICGIGWKKDHVRLFFVHGAFLPDPKSMLKGTGKAMRYVNLTSFDSITWDDLRNLIYEHANFDPRSLSIS